MSLLMQVIVNGLIAGAVYALVASGFSLIYSTCRFVHFAHGAVIAASAYFLYFLFSMLGLDFWLSCLLSIAFAACLGLAMDRAVYRVMRKRRASPTIMLLASFGLLIFFESLLLLLFGAETKTIGFIKIAKGVELLGAVITPLELAIIAVSLALLLLLFFFMKKTRTGKAMRAVADNKDVTEIVGISSEGIYGWSFAIGSALAGVAGILVGLEQNLVPSMGLWLMIRGFTGAVIGGIGSIPGAILGSFVLGLAENLGILFLPSGFKDAIAFTILFVFLLWKPNGILGIKRGISK